MLKMGEQKSIQTDRVVLVPGPDEEVKIVRWIYQDFISDGKMESEIAAGLNAQGIVTDFGRAWNRATVHQVLTNEKYIGNNVYHRTSFKLKNKHVNNPPDKWIRANGIFEGIVEPEFFLTAQEIILARSRKFTDDEMLEKLRAVLRKHGRISGILIDEADDLPSSTAFSHRFGTLVYAYRLIGYDPGIDFSFIEENRRLRKRRSESGTRGNSPAVHSAPGRHHRPPESGRPGPPADLGRGHSPWRSHSRAGARRAGE